MTAPETETPTPSGSLRARWLAFWARSGLRYFFSPEAANFRHAFAEVAKFLSWLILAIWVINNYLDQRRDRSTEMFFKFYDRRFEQSHIDNLLLTRKDFQDCAFLQIPAEQCIAQEGVRDRDQAIKLIDAHQALLAYYINAASCVEAGICDRKTAVAALGESAFQQLRASRQIICEQRKEPFYQDYAMIVETELAEPWFKAKGRDFPGLACASAPSPSAPAP